MNKKAINFEFTSYQFEPSQKRILFHYKTEFESGEALLWTETIILPAIPKKSEILSSKKKIKDIAQLKDFDTLKGVMNVHYNDDKNVAMFAEALKDEGFRFEEVPIHAGWRYFASLAEHVCSIDNTNGLAEAIPAVIFIDEAHHPSPIEEMFKLLINIKHPKLFERNGTRYYADPHSHAYAFASNEEVDPALKRRCLEIPFTSYDEEEKKQLIKTMCEKSINEQAIDYVESRTKPVAGEIEQVARRLNLQPIDRINIDIAKKVIKNMGLFPGGLVRRDLELMLRMAHDVRPTRIDTLKSKIGDIKTSATRNRLGWLQALELCETKRGGYILTKQGVTYLEDLDKQQQIKPLKNKKSNSSVLGFQTAIK